MFGLVFFFLPSHFLENGNKSSRWSMDFTHQSTPRSKTLMASSFEAPATSFSIDQRFQPFSSDGSRKLITKVLWHTKKYTVLFPDLTKKIGGILSDLQKKKNLVRVITCPFCSRGACLKKKIRCLYLNLRISGTKN